MHRLYKEKLGLTDEGAKGLVKSTWASFAVHLFNFLPAFLLLYFIDVALNASAIPKIGFLAASLLLLLLFYFVLNKEYILMYDETYKEAANLRIELIEEMTKLPLAYFSKHDISDLAQTFIADIFALEHALSHSIGKLVSFFMAFVLISIMLLAGNWKLALCIIAPTLIYLGMVLLSRKIQLRKYEHYYAQLRENSEAFQEAIEHSQDIKSFRLQNQIYGTLNKKMEQTEKIHIDSERASLIPMLLGGIMQNLSLAAVILAGSTLMLRGDISLLYVLAYILAAIKMKDGIAVMAGNITELYYLSPMVKRIKEIREAKTQEGSKKAFSRFDIRLESIDFSYDEDTPVLKNCSFAAEQGKVTALAGKSGCGKTSVMRLISRLYDPDRGRIFIGDVDTRTADVTSLHRNISMVFQDVTLFNTTVMENIRLGRPEASDEEVKEAARLANCDEFIRKMPQGYRTFIGENGAKLSGGERQRLSIARAFLKDAPILLLDEITAALDVDNERKIQYSLNRLIKGKTVIIISHRIKSVKNADHIVVLDEGRVIAEGRHDFLIETCDLYRDLTEKSDLAENFVY